MISKIVLALAGMWLLLGGIVASTIYKTGVMEISVHEKGGSNFYVPIPMLFLSGGVNFLPKDKLAEMRLQLGENRQALVNVMQALAECPDGVFVEVEGKREHVYIAKRDGNFIVDVDTPEEKVYVKIPLESSSRIVARLVQ